MKVFFYFLVGSIIFFTLGLTVFAQDKTADANSAKELETIYKEFDNAAKKRDIKLITKYLDNDYELERKDEILNRATVIQQVKSFFELASEISEASSKIESVKVKDGSYYLEVSSSMKGKLKLPDGTTPNFEITSKSTDVWTKFTEGWREVRQIERETRLLINGQEVEMN